MRVTNGKTQFRLIPQVLLLFALGILVTGIITYFTQRSLSDSAIQEQVETLANKVAEEAAASIHAYPAYDWLLSYVLLPRLSAIS